MPRVKKPSKPKKAPATAAGQALGYSLQFTRLTAMLLDAADGSVCSLEVLDDVAEQTAEGRTTLGQSKSALTGNPVADHAISLWKTLHNWLELVKLGHVVANDTIFEIYVSRDVTGDLVKAFHSTNSLKDSASAINKARNVMWGNAPGFTKKKRRKANRGPEKARGGAIMPSDYDKLMELCKPMSWSKRLLRWVAALLLFGLSVVLNAFLGLLLGTSYSPPVKYDSYSLHLQTDGGWLFSERNPPQDP